MTAILPPPEFSHVVPVSDIGSRVVHFSLVADANERAALTKRFDLLSLESLGAEVDLGSDDSGIFARGTLAASLSQACIISGAAVAATVEEAFDVRFVIDTGHEPDAEIELDADACDTMFYDGRSVDLGELVAQTLGLAINPYPRSPDADIVLKEAGVKGEGEVGPFAALAALRKDAG